MAPVAPAVVFEHVWLAFDEQVVLRDLSFAVPPGHTQVILGASGAGKSLILKLILGLLRPDSGTITLGGGPDAASHRHRDAVSGECAV